MESGATVTDTYLHRPVLLAEAIDALNITPAGIYVDATFGRGGHAQVILQRLGPHGALLGIDKDPQAVAAARQMFEGEPRFSIERGTFAMLGQYVQERGWMGKVNGVLLDLGVSSPQLDDPQRGFSFRQDGPLDMRMDPATGISAAQWLDAASEQEITSVLYTYGEERYARRIVRAIVAARQEAPITTTGRLAAIVAAANPAWERDKHPATRSFQAIRIFINHELEDVQTCLPQVVESLASGGRLAVISFHSLEDRIVKRFIREQVRGDDFPPGLPVTQAQLRPRLRAVGKAIYPGTEELQGNPRARSAVLRVAEKV
ncbi:MAG: 16S rRNA (cytosine(1402)-N(4))-methyltransferase RsmH [Gammaproteobacteria bacterium]